MRTGKIAVEGLARELDRFDLPREYGREHGRIGEAEHAKDGVVANDFVGQDADVRPVLKRVQPTAWQV